MFIEKPYALFKDCVIKPFDDLDGLITAVRYDRCGCEIQVRYILHGFMRENWFYDFDIELKDKQEDKKIGYCCLDLEQDKYLTPHSPLDNI